MLPIEIGKLMSLEILYISSNKLESIPKEIGNLTNLTHLDLRNTRLNQESITFLQSLNINDL